MNVYVSEGKHDDADELLLLNPSDLEQIITSENVYQSRQVQGQRNVRGTTLASLRGLGRARCGTEPSGGVNDKLP